MAISHDLALVEMITEGCQTAMKMKLFANSWPSGSCVSLARELATTTNLGASAAIRAAASVFGMNHRAENPLEIKLLENAETARLQQLCEEFGIAFDFSMDQTIHDKLIAADRLAEWERPTGVTDDLWTTVDSLVPAIESLTGYQLDVDRNVQDASFLTDVGLLDDRYFDRATSSGVIYYIFSFRFSNFGRLFTLHGGEWQQRFDEFRLGECLDLIQSRGFIYIPAAELDSPYDGVNRSDHSLCSPPITWWIRFFDYL